ncbi:hypothetical protein [Micromonospora sp. DH14]|uniref:hypothetical protein n=1 Tax=Micromonospora sp. DH14 TaxID=3040120 RepID=UPI002442E334|nr:hypothetical protein [Micromonospora sp. DH14]MDG9674822.1 hypothetical protein [Micromonospora sp. DH14]
MTASPNRRALVSRLIASRGLALQLYLVTLFECQSTRHVGAYHHNRRTIQPARRDEVCWLDLLAVPVSPTTIGTATRNDNRIRQIKSAIARLEREEVVRLPNTERARDRYEGFVLLDEHRDENWRPGSDYTIPRVRESFKIPTDFFYNGWIYCLTDSEVALWLTFKLLSHEHPAAHAGGGIFLADRERLQRFGLSRDAYESHAALVEYGLLTGVDNAARYKTARSAEARGAGEAEPLHFRLTDDGLQDCAFCVIPRSLVRSSQLGGWQLRDRESWEAKVQRVWRQSHTQFCGSGHAR